MLRYRYFMKSVLKFTIVCFIFLAVSNMAFAQDSSMPDGIEEMMAKAAQFNRRMEDMIERYRNADIKKDAEDSFKKNDLRLISIMGYTEYTPGINDESLEIEQYGTICMPDTGDVILSQKHGEFQQVARDYAKRYNDEMLSLIKEQNNLPLALTIKSDKEIYQAGENIMLSVSLESKSGQEMIVYWNNDTPSLRTEESGAVLAYMAPKESKDFEILHIEPRGIVRKTILVKSSALSGEIMLKLQYNPMDLKVAHKAMALFKSVLVSNTISLRVDQRVPDVLDVECMRALSIGADYIAVSKLPSGDYKLIKAENMVTSGSYMGPHIWHLTYKARDIIHHGKGGEVFVEVDMNTQEAKLLGYGE